jgi:hypothetical protein
MARWGAPTLDVPALFLADPFMSTSYHYDPETNSASSETSRVESPAGTSRRYLDTSGLRMVLHMAFADALRVLNTMKADGVIEEYAVAGGLAIVFWTEPLATYDLDVLVFLPSGAGPLVSLESICRWASAHSYVADMEHILIEGVPTQFSALSL